jgi:uncharacterized protein with ATP-grasp and redox domains
MKEQELVKLEFLMKVNDNFIIQRFFNVRNYNPDAKNSMDLYYYIRDLINQFQYKLKMRSVVYLLDNNDEITFNPEILNTSFIEGPEHFSIMVKKNNETICHRVFDAKIYPPKIRYTVDIRNQIKSILNDLTDIFSSDELSYDYLEYNTQV